MEEGAAAPPATLQPPMAGMLFSESVLFLCSAALMQCQACFPCVQLPSRSLSLSSTGMWVMEKGSWQPASGFCGCGAVSAFSPPSKRMG